MPDPDDDGCPKGDPDCTGNNGDCHDACETFADRRARLQRGLAALDRFCGIAESLSGNGCHHGYKPARACPDPECEGRLAQETWDQLVGSAAARRMTVLDEASTVPCAAWDALAPAESPPPAQATARPLMRHDRPCRECAHFRQQFMAGSYCRKKLMGVTPDMRVGYYADPAPGWPGLCFEASRRG